MFGLPEALCVGREPEGLALERRVKMVASVGTNRSNAVRVFSFLIELVNYFLKLCVLDGAVDLDQARNANGAIKVYLQSQEAN